jgi:trehalose 6-phosphate phosphatase
VRLLAGRAARCAILCDFDGTLAPIVPDPADARPLPGSVELLHHLATRYAVVAVVSGRPAAFLADRLELHRLDLPASPSLLQAVGLYGLEVASPTGGPPGTAVSEGEPWRAAVEAATAFLAPSMPPGTLLEPKGLTLGLHWRNAPEAEASVIALGEAASKRYGLVLRHGRMAAELVPPVAVDKGSVVRRLTSDLEAACFVGDDAGDIPAFAALDERSAGGGFTALKVAVASAESPLELLASADLVLDGPPEVLRLLEALDAALDILGTLVTGTK